MFKGITIGRIIIQAHESSLYRLYIRETMYGDLVEHVETSIERDGVWVSAELKIPCKIVMLKGSGEFLVNSETYNNILYAVNAAQQSEQWENSYV